MLRETGFREPAWQRLHMACLSLMRQAILVARSQHASASNVVPARPVVPEPDSTGCIDLTSDSRSSSDSGPEPITQVRSNAKSWCLPTLSGPV